MTLDSHHYSHDTVPASQLEPLVPATPRGEATRRKLLAAAEEEFGAKGFHVASVSSVTTRAGVGQGTFYLYFRSKEEVFVTLVREIGRTLRRQMRESIAGAVDRLDAERRAMDAFFAYACAHPGLYRIVQESQFIDEPVYREYYQRIASGYIADLDSAAQRGEIAPGNAEVRAWSLMGMGHFLGMRYCLWSGQPPPPEALDALMELVSQGIAVRK